MSTAVFPRGKEVRAGEQTTKATIIIRGLYTYTTLGPSELTIFHPQVMNLIGGPGTTCIKAAWYDMLYPLVALNSVRGKAGYTPRRRVWDNALGLKGESMKSLQKSYMTDEWVVAVNGEKLAILQALDKLDTAFRDRQGEPVNVTEWLSYLTTDIMGQLAFNNDFGMLDMHKWEGMVVLRKGMAILGTVTPAPWLAHVLFTFVPKSLLLWAALTGLAKSIMKDRLEKEFAKVDVSYWMIDAARSSDGTISTNDLYGDSFAMIVAGRLVYPCIQAPRCIDFKSLT